MPFGCAGGVAAELCRWAAKNWLFLGEGKTINQRYLGRGSSRDLKALMKTSSLNAALVLGMCIVGLNIRSVAAPLRNWPTATLGEHDSTVRVLQYLLAAHGYSMQADGFFGKATEKTLRRFQQTHQLVASGETNDPTWESLIVSLHQGSKGPAVRAAQFELREAGYAVVMDGVFSSQMKTVVQKYQKQTGHTADGLIGRNTWYELLGATEGEGD